MVEPRVSILRDSNEPIPTNVRVNPTGPIAERAGDWNADAEVTIGELVRGVNIAAVMPFTGCACFDEKCDGALRSRSMG
jgi:hypothetical protein